MLEKKNSMMWQSWPRRWRLAPGYWQRGCLGRRGRRQRSRHRRRRPDSDRRGRRDSRGVHARQVRTLKKEQAAMQERRWAMEGQRWPRRWRAPVAVEQRCV